MGTFLLHSRRLRTYERGNISKHPGEHAQRSNRAHDPVYLLHGDLPAIGDKPGISIEELGCSYNARTVRFRTWRNQ